MTLSDSLSTALKHHGDKLLGDATEQANDLGNVEDSEALHDFRVSVRRLRSFLKSFEDYLKDAKRHRQKLSRIMDLTNAGRDTEVHIAWLKDRQEKASTSEKAGLTYLLEHLTSDEHVDLEKVKKQFDSAAKKLSKVFLGDIKIKEDIIFGAATAKVLQHYRDKLESLLQAIKDAEDETIHVARIVGKRLRYTLELLDGKEATALVKQLKKLQDNTGDLHDLQVLEPKVHTFIYAETTLWAEAFRENATTLSQDELKELPELQRSYALAEVARTVEQEKSSLYRELETHWLGEASKGFFADIDEFIRQLSSSEATEVATQEQEEKPKTKKPKKTREKSEAA